MELENLKYFELNNNVLNDFDKLMSMHLDYIEELKITEINTNSKFLNIISLCINIKTIIIEGDQRVNTNMIVSNICKPEILENLVLKNVKLPSGHILKKLSGLKTITLENIRFTNIGKFFQDIPESKNVEKIIIRNSDFERNSIKILEKFENIKKLELTNVTNINLEKIEFLTSNQNVEEIIITNNSINIKEINNILKGKAKKIINCEINSNKKSVIKDKFEIDEQGNLLLTINSVNLDNLVHTVNIYRMKKITLILENLDNLDEYIKPLKQAKGAISVLIKDVSQLTSNEAKKLQEKLRVNSVDMLSSDGENVEVSYSIEDYIVIRKEIEKYTRQVYEKNTEIEKFLKIYKLLAEKISVDDCFGSVATDFNYFKNELVEQKCLSIDFSKILHNCLSCLEIESTIVYGNLTKNNANHSWNQVKINNCWYNVDIALDSSKLKSKNILRRKSKYCLLSDKNFYETHIPTKGQTNYAENDFDKKILNVYFKTEIISDRIFKTYFDIFVNKIKKVLNINTQKALPAATEINVNEK